MHAVFAAFFSLALLAWSAITVAIELAAAPARAFAEAIEVDRVKLRDARLLARAEATLLQGSRWCAREAIQAGVTIRLASVDSSPVADPDRRAAALAKARDTLRNGLACFPRDGNLWLRLAMVEHALSGNAGTVVDMLRASHAAAPSEAWVVLPRISFAALLGEAAPAEVGEILSADAATLATHGRIADVAQLYSRAPPHLRTVLEAAFGTVERERSAAIDAAIAARRPSPARDR